MFKKFDRTPHLPWSGKVSKDDKRISAEEFYNAISKGKLIVQEKVDGANLGITLVDGKVQLQSRGHVLQSGGIDHPQFSPAYNYFYSIFDNLYFLENRILFGEWCYAKHHVPYDRLPSYFIAFDIYDLNKEYYLSKSRIEELNIKGINWINDNIPFDVTLFKRLDNEKAYAYLEFLTRYTPYSSKSFSEGLYFRVEDEEKVILRAKFVRKDFFTDDEDAFAKRTVFDKNLLI